MNLMFSNDQDRPARDRHGLLLDCLRQNDLMKLFSPTELGQMFVSRIAGSLGWRSDVLVITGILCKTIGFIHVCR